MKHPITTRTVEIRDRATCISALVIYLHPEKGSEATPDWLLRRVGWGPGEDGVILMELEKAKAQVCHEDWDDRSRTMGEAHQYIWRLWAMQGKMVADGALIDVEFILSETSEPKLTDNYGRFGN